ncbi:MAG: hypothetical protein ABSF77_00090 [Spirochaetia bacterium]|jgi:hypothetical protein
MKKRGMLLAAIVLMLLSLPAFAQEQSYPKDAYVKTVPLMKVWMHQLGYVLQFWNSHSQIGEIYVPVTWFNKGPASKAEIIYGNDRAYPYCAIVWVDGKFDHISLYVPDNYGSPAWGVMETSADLTSKFDIQEVAKDF